MPSTSTSTFGRTSFGRRLRSEAAGHTYAPVVSSFRTAASSTSTPTRTRLTSAWLRWIERASTWRSSHFRRRWSRHPSSPSCGTNERMSSQRNQRAIAAACVSGRTAEIHRLDCRRHRPAHLASLTPLLNKLQAQHQLMFVHPGPAVSASQGWWAPGVDYAAQMQASYAAWVAYGARRWPELRVVFALLAGGAPFQVERLVRRGLDSRSPLRRTCGSDVVVR